MSDKQQIRLGLVGYGEIGSTLGQGLREAGLQRIASYDKYAFDGPYSALIQGRAAAARVTLVGSPEQLVEAADLIVSVTPGSASLESAEAFAPHLTGQHVFIDIASATPKLKQGVAERLSGTNALLADGSIMGTPKDGFAMPILTSGPAAERFRDALVPWGMRIEAVGDVLGTASGIKIIRSVLIKGIEALLDEMLLTAHAYGIDDTVLDSASKTLSRPWMETVNSLIPTGVIHAQRRTEEVEMAAEAVQDAGIEPIMTRSTAARLRWKDQLGMKEHFGGVVPPSYKEAVDAIASKIGQVRGGAGS